MTLALCALVPCALGACRHGHTFVACLPGGCKLLLRHFRPSVALEDLDRDDEYKLVSEIFKIKANDLLDHVNGEIIVEVQVQQVVRLDLEDLRDQLVPVVTVLVLQCHAWPKVLQQQLASSCKARPSVSGMLGWL